MYGCLMNSLHVMMYCSLIGCGITWRTGLYSGLVSFESEVWEAVKNAGNIHHLLISQFVSVYMFAAVHFCAAGAP